MQQGITPYGAICAHRPIVQRDEGRCGRPVKPANRAVQAESLVTIPARKGDGQSVEVDDEPVFEEQILSRPNPPAVVGTRKSVPRIR
ncbi:hypothetical protein D918_07380 [Trichuris suis]|nr:hypothetical protein D918_07380 [Trichuris suis]